MGIFSFMKSKKTSAPIAKVRSSSVITQKNDRRSYFDGLIGIDEVRKECVRQSEGHILSAFLGLCEGNVIGQGFKLSILDKQDFSLSAKLKEDIARHWELFCQLGNFEVTGDLTFDTFCRLLLRSYVTTGEGLVKIVRDENTNDKNPYGTQFQLLNVSRIDTKLNDKNIVNGVEFDNSGRMVKLHLRSLDNTFNNSTTTELFEDIIFIANKSSPEQVRGTPIVKKALPNIEMFKKFEEYAINSARKGAFLSMFVTSEEAQLAQTTEEEEFDLSEIKVSNFGVVGLPQGHKIQTVTDAYPESLYNTFLNSEKDSVARALGVSSIFLFNKIDTANYAIAKFMSSKDDDTYHGLQRVLIDTVIRKIFKEFLISLVNHYNFNPKILRLRYSFMGHRTEEIDGIKTENAKSLKVKSFRKSVADSAKEDGNDISDVIRANIESAKLLREELMRNGESVSLASCLIMLTGSDKIPQEIEAVNEEDIEEKNDDKEDEDS